MENNQRLKKLAQRLVAYEAAAGSRPANGPSVFLVCEKFHAALSRSMGAAGFRALLLRASALASQEVPWLRELKIKPDGRFQGLEQVEAELSKDAIDDGEIAVIAQLLGLLITFIGPRLTLGLLREIWPDAPAKHLIF